MQPVYQFMIFQATIIAAFSAGTIICRKYPQIFASIKKIIRTNIYFLTPFIVFWSTMGIPMNADLLLLPLSGLILCVAGLLFGQLISRVLIHEKKERAGFMISASLSNHGFTMGGFIAFLLLGEEGLGMASVFIAYFPLYIYTFVFTFAGVHGKGHTWSLKAAFRSILHPNSLPLAALMLTFLLRSTGVERPELNIPMLPILLVSVALSYFALGMAFDTAAIRQRLREHLLLAAVKFGALPGAAFLTATLLPLSELMRQIVLLESFMPAAVYSVITAALFDLDHRQASSLFAVNTLIFVLVVFPVLLLVF